MNDQERLVLEGQIEDLKLALKSYELELDMADATIESLKREIELLKERAHANA